MREVAVAFGDVWKSYPSYMHVVRGIKAFLFNLPQVFKDLYSRRTALEGLSFEIYKGENFGFIGNNGAGKSTTLGLIAGVLSPDKGLVTIRGRVSPLLELGAGFHPELSGRDNILLNGVLLGLTRREVLEYEAEIIAFAGLGEFIDMPVRTYSSGMYAKLGFAVVTILKPEILLLDEILAVGDIAFQRKCKAVFENFRDNPEVTMVLVSHSMENIAEVCDRAAWIDNKQIRALGAAKDVIREYQAANAIKVQVAGVADGPPPHICLGGVEELDCSQFPAMFYPRVSGGFPDPALKITLFHKGSHVPLGFWRITPQLVSLGAKDGSIRLETASGELCPFVPGARTGNSGIDLNRPLLISLQIENLGTLQGAAVWLPVCAAVAARRKLSEDKARIMAQAAGSGFPPFLWPGGKTVRVAARNIMSHDAVGNFAVGIAATLAKYGIPARLYAYTSCAELAGMVSPVGDLERETEPDDIIFYHYSTEDEFLPMISRLRCHRKILYYHNVTPGEWFRGLDPEFARALDRAREQFTHFARFDAAAANSRFSLNDILPYIAGDTPTMVYPPAMAPEKLAAVTPEAVFLPRAGRTLLWVGRMAPHKRPELALELFSRLCLLRQDAALVMVVSGRRDLPLFAEQLENNLAALPAGVRERIIVYEGLSEAQLAYVYGNSSLFLCTSGHEGYCLPISEAMSFGLPVAAFPQQAVEENLAGRGTVLPENTEEAAWVLFTVLSQEMPPPRAGFSLPHEARAGI
ncbi:MAG: ATP-binding cassette domain-containing protein [Desulfarculales bacterium]|jgi:lipopolysaccharide transport system ATP-binding protein|nr:ATP-binding cassette domain-containing protein [Desulfarculales bacterium]